MTKRHAAVALTVLLAIIGTTARAEQWATCRFTHNEERRCV
ncbi:MAG: hypothetical protein OXN84_21265 [Albidovulum sp.]|nr:hypothetical protein [Albidovulum sp.]MDE0531180.1 hypothetical protein [Albidovulum sp.]